MANHLSTHFYAKNIRVHMRAPILRIVPMKTYICVHVTAAQEINDEKKLQPSPICSNLSHTDTRRSSCFHCLSWPVS